MDFQSLLTQWMGLAGIAALIAVVINVLKLAGVVKDGSAQTWSAGLNLAGMAALLLLKIFRPEIDLSGIDQQAAALAEVAMVVLGYLTQLLSAKLAHLAVKRVPLIGASFSAGEEAQTQRERMAKRLAL